MTKSKCFICLLGLIMAVSLSSCGSNSADGDNSVSETVKSRIEVSYITEDESDTEADNLVYKETNVPVVALRKGSNICIDTQKEYEDVYITIDGEVVEEVGTLTTYSSYNFTAEKTGMYIIYATVDGEVKNVTEEFVVSNVKTAE